MTISNLTSSSFKGLIPFHLDEQNQEIRKRRYTEIRDEHQFSRRQQLLFLIKTIQNGSPTYDQLEQLKQTGVTSEELDRLEYIRNMCRLKGGGTLDRIRQDQIEKRRRDLTTMFTNVPYQAHMERGRGIDAEGKVYGSALKRPFSTERVANQYRLVQFFKLISNQQESSQAIETMAEAEVTHACFEVSGKFDKVDKMSSSDNHLHCILIAAYENDSYEKIDGRELSEEASALLDKKGVEEFVRVYGTHYIGSHLQAASFFGEIEIKTSTKEEASKLAAKLSAKVGIGPIKVGVDVEHNQEFKEAISNHEVECSLSVQGIKIPLGHIGNVDQLLEAFGSFCAGANQAQITDSPSRTLCYPYTDIPEFNAKYTRDDAAILLAKFRRIKMLLDSCKYDEVADYLLESGEGLEGQLLEKIHREESEVVRQALAEILCFHENKRGLALAERWLEAKAVEIQKDTALMAIQESQYAEAAKILLRSSKKLEILRLIKDQLTLLQNDNLLTALGGEGRDCLDLPIDVLLGERRFEHMAERLCFSWKNGDRESIRIVVEKLKLSPSIFHLGAILIKTPEDKGRHVVSEYFPGNVAKIILGSVNASQSFQFKADQPGCGILTAYIGDDINFQHKGGGKIGMVHVFSETPNFYLKKGKHFSNWALKLDEKNGSFKIWPKEGDECGLDKNILAVEFVEGWNHSYIITVMDPLRSEWEIIPIDDSSFTVKLKHQSLTEGFLSLRKDVEYKQISTGSESDALKWSLI